MSTAPAIAPAPAAGTIGQDRDGPSSATLGRDAPGQTAYHAQPEEARKLQESDLESKLELRSRAVRQETLERESAADAKEGKEAAKAGEIDGLDKRVKEREKDSLFKAKKEIKKVEPRVWRRNGGRPSFARVYLGDGNSLDLISLEANTTIEGPRARTVLDYVFRNPHERQLEGTFEYPLPSGASPSYFAMFLGATGATVPPRFARPSITKGALAALPSPATNGLAPELLVRDVDTHQWGQLQEARIVGKDKALEAYEEVVRGRVDPALLEYASGNTFRGRVFPIAPKGFNRVILAYEETLPISQGSLHYQFPLPECKLQSMNFSLRATASDFRETRLALKDAKRTEAAGAITWTRTWTDEEPDGLAEFVGTPTRADLQVVTGKRGENGPIHAYARVRPELKTIAADRARATHAVFLLDTSLSEHADRFGLSMKLLRKVLEGDPAIQQFNVLAFNVATQWVEPKGWLPNTPQGREKLWQRLDGIALEGATDVGAALEQLATPPGSVPDKMAVDCFLLSDGHATWGEAEVATLVGQFEGRCKYRPRFHCYRTGLGAENAELYEALTRRGGGIFNCFTEADLNAAASAHRNQCLQVEAVRFVGGPAASDVLVAGRRAAVYPNGELIVAGRFASAGKTTLVVEGTFAGHRFAQEFPVEVREGGELAARGWAEIAVASMLALNNPKLDTLVVAYCQQFNIGSRLASFLVLENDAEYKRLNLEEERGKTSSGDLAVYLDKLWTSIAGPVTPRAAFDRLLERLGSRPNLIPGNARESVRRLAALMTDREFELPSTHLTGALVERKQLPVAYLANRERDPRNVETYLTEAKRRMLAGDGDGAVRALSCIIEEHPSRGDALRLVGYRLLDMRQPGQAAQLFERVREQRPFEPHSYRDLARALEATGNIALAAVQYEIVLGSVWHNRFGESLKLVAQEEYARLMQDAIRRQAVSQSVANYFGERLETMTNPQPKADLRVTISWNTDATDVDLWVIEPDGTKCFYQHNRTKNGGELSQDLTQGYGPERYQVIQALKGRYRVLVHYFNDNPNLLSGDTHVNVTVTRFAGSPQESTTRHTVVLKKKGEEAEVCTLDY